MSNIKKDTYISNIRLEGTSGYPPRLIQIRDQGIKEETALLSIIPKLNIRQLSLAEPHTIMSGTLEIDCGSEYQKIENFNLVSYSPGDSMKQEFFFKNIPPDRVCLVTAQTLECETKQPKCDKNSVSLTLRIPGL